MTKRLCDLTPEQAERQRASAKAYSAAYFATEAGNAKRNESAKRWLDKNRHKHAAIQAANRAKKSGRLVPTPCEICGAEKVEMHHEDYSQPLVVRFLCRAHHREQHRARKGDGRRR